MAAATVKSASITGFDAVPVTLRQGSNQGGKVRQYTETIEVATTNIDDVGDIIKMIRIPSRLKITRCDIFNDDLDTNGTPLIAVDVGFYNAVTGAVKDADGLASAITTLNATNTAGVNVAMEAHDIADIGKTAWELAGYTTDPHVMLDIALTVTAAAATGAAGTITMVVTGTLDN